MNEFDLDPVLLRRIRDEIADNIPDSVSEAFILVADSVLNTNAVEFMWLFIPDKIHYDHKLLFRGKQWSDLVELGVAPDKHRHMFEVLEEANLRKGFKDDKIRKAAAYLGVSFVYEPSKNVNYTKMDKLKSDVANLNAYPELSDSFDFCVDDCDAEYITFTVIVTPTYRIPLGRAMSSALILRKAINKHDSGRSWKLLSSPVLRYKSVDGTKYQDRYDPACWVYEVTNL